VPVSWRERHLAKVRRLEDAAADVVLGKLDRVLDRIADGFGATVAAADDEPAGDAGSPDDLAALGSAWQAAVDRDVLPWFGRVYQEGGDAAVEQVTETRAEAGISDPVPEVAPGVPSLMDEAAARHLAEARPRFTALGDEAWTKARAELVTGLAEGDDLGRMRRRLRSVTDLSRAQADQLARTEVIAAANAGSMTRVRLMGDDAPPYKQWLATMDARTRPTHMAADGRVVAREERFEVGAASLDYPGDHTGPPGECINCRCTVLFVDSPEALVVDGRQQGGTVDQIDVPPASAAGWTATATAGEFIRLEGGELDLGVMASPEDVDALREDIGAWSEHFRVVSGTEAFQLDVDRSIALVACATTPPQVSVTVRGERVTLVRGRDADGNLMDELVLTAAAWTPPPDAVCIEEGCGEPVAGRRPLTASIDELVCARHLRESADLGHPTTDSVTGEKHTGAMIALLPSEEDAERLALEGGESTRQLHVTLWFLGDAAAIPAGLREAIRHEAEDRAATYEPFEANVFGASIWNPNGERGGSLNWNVGGPDDLEDIRASMRQGLVLAPDWVEEDVEAAQAWEMADNHAPWAAHMCAMYAPTDELTAALPAALERVGPITLDRVRLTFADEVIDIPLGAGQDADVVEEDTTMGETAAATSTQDAAVPKPPPGKRVKKAPNGQCPPGYRPDGDGCVSTTTPAKGDSAAGGPGAPPETECPPGQQMVDGECVPEESTEAVTPQALPGEHFRAVMHIQNVSTGRRTFRNLTWREPPFAMHRQRSSSAHGGLPEVVQTGLVSRVVQDGDTLYGFGPLDLDSEEGLEHARRLVSGFDRWVSIGLDEQPSNIEVVWPEVDEDDDGNPLSAMLQEPEQIIFDGGRIGELTSVSVPAQDQATIEPTPELIRLMEQRMGTPAEDAPAEDDVLVASVVGSTDLPVADRDAAWDGTGAMNRVWAWANDGQDTARVGRAFLYRDADADPKTKGAWKLGFADVVDGQLKIIPRGVAATAGGRGVNSASIPEADKARIRSKICTLYGKVRAVYDDWGDCPFDSSSEAAAIAEGYTFADAVQGLTAAAWRIEVTEVPPRWWYDEPTDVEMTSALNITDDGRIFAVLAPMGVGHRAFANSGRRLEVPMGNVDYDRFMGGWAVTSKGKIAAGPITMDCSHASRFRADHDVAPAHYDNSCTVFGTVRVGENRDKGYVWAAGALAPGVTPDELARALACRLSGDWQPHPDRPGYQELIAALLVPSPGFPMAHAGPSLSVGEEIDVGGGVLVASSVHAEVPVRQATAKRAALRVDPAHLRVERVEAS
jgi:hypothetical protein